MNFLNPQEVSTELLIVEVLKKLRYDFTPSRWHCEAKVGSVSTWWILDQEGHTLGETIDDLDGQRAFYICKIFNEYSENCLNESLVPQLQEKLTEFQHRDYISLVIDGQPLDKDDWPEYDGVAVMGFSKASTETKLRAMMSAM